MTQVISFISRKGGTGKTTNAINIATNLAAMKKKVIVIETDINYTLNQLRDFEKETGSLDTKNAPELITTEETSVVKEIKHYQKDGSYDFIIVDSAGNTSEYGTNRLCSHSDLVVIPTSLSQNDRMVTKATLDYVFPAMEENPNLKVLILPVRIHSRTKIDTVHSALSDLGTPVLGDFVPSKKSFSEVSTVNANKEYKSIVKLLLKQL